MPIDVFETPLATLQVRSLRGRRRRAYNRFLDELARLGCGALRYRLSGSGIVERTCVRHLYGDDRVVVAFSNHATAWVLLVGPHVSRDTRKNVYDNLYRLTGGSPPDLSQRTKPPCCDEVTGDPPVMAGDFLELILNRAERLTS